MRSSRFVPTWLSSQMRVINMPSGVAASWNSPLTKLNSLENRSSWGGFDLSLVIKKGISPK